MPTGSKVDIELLQQFVDALLYGVVVVSGVGQTVAAVGSVAPQAADDFAGKLVHGLPRDCGHQLKVGGVDGLQMAFLPSSLRSITTLAPSACRTYQFFTFTQAGIVLPL